MAVDSSCPMSGEGQAVECYHPNGLRPSDLFAARGLIFLPPAARRYSLREMYQNEPCGGLSHPSVLQDRGKCGASAVRESAIKAIVHDEPADGHRRHRLRINADCCVVDAGRSTKKDYAVLET